MALYSSVLELMALPLPLPLIAHRQSYQETCSRLNENDSHLPIVAGHLHLDP
jgi:hypothetical protein